MAFNQIDIEIRNLTMKELTKHELAQVSGGNYLIGLGFGILGSYVYDSIGGKQGVDSYLESSVASARTSINYWSGRILRKFR